MTSLVRSEKGQEVVGGPTLAETCAGNAGYVGSVVGMGIWNFSEDVHVLWIPDATKPPSGAARRPRMGAQLRVEAYL
jgi:hypothetical protein